jgi:hypothetical protein
VKNSINFYLSLTVLILCNFSSLAKAQPLVTSPSSASVSCQVQNLNELKATLKTRYKAFNSSINLLLTDLRDSAIPLERIKTQDQINHLDSIYSCVLEAQDNQDLGQIQHRIAIRQTITDISNILTPAKDGFNNLKIPEGDVETTINEIEQKLETLNTKLKSKIGDLSYPTATVPPSSGDDSSLPLIGFLWMSAGGLLAIVSLILPRSRKKSPLPKTQQPLNGSTSSRDSDHSPVNVELRELKRQIFQDFETLKNQQNELSKELKKLETRASSVERGLGENQKLSEAAEADTLSNLAPEIQEILRLYNNRYGELEKSAKMVSQEPESYSKRLSGFQIPIVLELNTNYKFLIVDDCYLVPKSGYKITSIIKQTIEDIFECKNFYSGARFKVVQPAIVTAIQVDRWQVTQKGILQFE